MLPLTIIIKGILTLGCQTYILYLKIYLYVSRYFFKLFIGWPEGTVYYIHVFYFGHDHRERSGHSSKYKNEGIY